jgi:glycine C-acetyltransferase
MSIELIKHLQSVLEDIHQQGLFKPERPLESPQGPSVHAQNWDEDLINLCANNYLGLANHPVMLAAAHEGLDSHGFGMASVRFICGTQDIHKALERKVADFVGMDDAILFSSCFDANGGIFEVLLDANDAVISDSLNHRYFRESAGDLRPGRGARRAGHGRRQPRRRVYRRARCRHA